MNFSQRSNQPELLDRDDIPFADIRRNMQELDFINTYLGGHDITLDGLQHILPAGTRQTGKEYVICEIGCGGGDNLLAINKWCGKNNLKAQFIGIDINPDCIEVASEKLAALNVRLICSDYLKATLNPKPDIIFSSLFCHHFTNEALIIMLRWMYTNSTCGYFINDLQRHPLAYYSIQILTKLFSRSYLVKNDAPLSVLRGFKKNEWEHLLQAAGIPEYAIFWKWAFRYLIAVNAGPDIDNRLNTANE